MNISTQSQYQPSFKGLTKIFKNHLINDAHTYEKLIATSKDEFVGSLPKEIIDKIIAVSQTKEEKNKIIRRILKGFAQITKELQKPEKKPTKASYINIADIKEQKKSAKKASKTITKIFQKNKLIKNTEQIKISPFKENEGCFGIVFDLIFPKSLNCSKKVIKVFKKKNPENLKPKYLKLHGVSAEANAATYISKQQGTSFQKSVFVKPYISSPKHQFMINEHIDNYPNEKSNWYKIQRFFNSKNITCKDIVKGWSYNIKNNRIYDFGAIELLNDKLNQKSFKIFKELEQADRKGIITNNNEPLIAVIQKYLTTPQKTTKKHPFEIENAIQNFISTREFESDVINTIKEINPNLLK